MRMDSDWFQETWIVFQQVKCWFSTPGLNEGVKLGPLCSRETITTDASQAGWGAVWRGNPVQGKWEASWIGEHINLLELEAVFRALIHFLPQFQEKRVIVRSDSTTVVSYINHQGGVRSISLHRKAQDLLLWAHAQGVSLSAVHLPGEDNVAADLLSRGGPRPEEWGLHPALIQATWLRFGKAKVDIFATQENTHCPLWYSMVGPRGGCSGKQMAPSTPVCISSFPTSACSPGQGENVEGQSPAGGTRLASTVMDAGSNRFAERVTMVSPSQTGHAVSGPRSDLPAEFREEQVSWRSSSN